MLHHLPAHAYSVDVCFSTPLPPDVVAKKHFKGQTLVLNTELDSGRAWWLVYLQRD